MGRCATEVLGLSSLVVVALPATSGLCNEPHLGPPWTRPANEIAITSYFKRLFGMHKVTYTWRSRNWHVHRFSDGFSIIANTDTVLQLEGTESTDLQKHQRPY
jgi:hypothetical protein